MLYFRAVNFCVKRSIGRFKIPSDQIIEQTINRDQKCHGGITGYSTSARNIQRWVLKSHTLAQCQLTMEDCILVNTISSRPKDLGPSRIKFDADCVQRLYNVLVELGGSFEYRESLVNLCSGLEAPRDVANDLLTAWNLG